ncbi:lipopolysaccharide biosynthesis protein [Planctomycetota bacterium]
MNQHPITTSKRLVYNSILNVAGLVTHAVIGFFLIRFFLGRFGEVRYGIWVLIGGSMFRYAPMLSMGLNSSVNRYVPLYLAKNDYDGIQRVINTSLLFFVVLAIVLIIVSLVIYNNVDSWFAIEPEQARAAGILVLIVGFSCALAMPLQPSTAILSGLQRYDLINLVSLIVLLSRTVLIVLLLLRNYGLLTTGLVFGLSEIIVRIWQAIFARRLLPNVSLSLAKIDFRLLKEMLPYGINTFLYAMGALIIYHASSLIIGIFIGAAEISQFTVAAAGVFLLSQLLNAFTAAIKPAVSDLDARDDNATVKEIALLTQKYSLLLIIPSACFLIAMGREFLHVWVSDRFKDPAVIDTMAVILTILAIGHCLRLAQHSNFLVLVGRGRHKIFAALTALTALLCVSASVIAVKVLNRGLIGIAWSNFLPMALISGIVLPIYFNWKMHISALENALKVWLPALLGSLPAVTMIILWKYLAPPDSWLEIGGVFLGAAALTFVGGWFLSLTSVEQKRFARIARRK